MSLHFAFIGKYLIIINIMMVDVAQLVEHQVVALGAVGSNPTIHPIFYLQES